MTASHCQHTNIPRQLTHHATAHLNQLLPPFLVRLYKQHLVKSFLQPISARTSLQPLLYFGWYHLRNKGFGGFEQPPKDERRVDDDLEVKALGKEGAEDLEWPVKNGLFWFCLGAAAEKKGGKTDLPWLPVSRTWGSDPTWRSR
jgi:hypothetical protein